MVKWWMVKWWMVDRNVGRVIGCQRVQPKGRKKMKKRKEQKKSQPNEKLKNEK